MKYEGRYWTKEVGFEKKGPFEFSIEVDDNNPDSDKEAIEKAKKHVMCFLDIGTTEIRIEDSQLRVGNQWVNLTSHK